MAQLRLERAALFLTGRSISSLLLRQHCSQIGDVGGRLVRRQVGLAISRLRRSGPAARRRARGSGARGGYPAWAAARRNVVSARQDPWQARKRARIRQHRGFLRNDLEGGDVVALRFRVAAHLVEHGALSGQDVPVGLVGRMGAVEHFQRLLEITRLGERAAIRASTALSLGLRVRPFEDGDCLRALSGSAQGLCIVDGGLGICRICAVAITPGIGGTPPVRLPLRVGSQGE